MRSKAFLRCFLWPDAVEQSCQSGCRPLQSTDNNGGVLIQILRCHNVLWIKANRSHNFTGFIGHLRWVHGHRGWQLGQTAQLLHPDIKIWADMANQREVPKGMQIAADTVNDDLVLVAPLS